MWGSPYACKDLSAQKDWCCIYASHFAQVHLTLALEMSKNAKLLNVPVLGYIVRVLGSFAGLIGRTKDAEMK